MKKVKDNKVKKIEKCGEIIEIDDKKNNYKNRYKNGINDEDTNENENKHENENENENEDKDGDDNYHESNDALPYNWQLKFVHNQLFENLHNSNRFCPGAYLHP